MYETKRQDDRHCAVLKNKAKSLLNPNICVGELIIGNYWNLCYWNWKLHWILNFELDSTPRRI